jgi:hypothetical protein
VEDDPLHVGIRTGGRKNLEGASLRVGDPLDPDHRGRATCHHVRVQHGIALALCERAFEIPPEVLNGPDVGALGEQQPCSGTRRSRRERGKLPGQQIRDSLGLTRRRQVPGEGEHPLAAL